MKRLISKQSAFYKYKIRKKFRLLIVIFALVVVVGAFSYMQRPELFKKLINTVVSTIKSKNLDDISTFNASMVIFLNNLKVAFMAIVLGFIPFVFLSAFPIITNALILGVFSTMFVEKLGSVQLMLALLVPHGVVELLAIIYAGALGINLCYEITTKITKNKQTKIATIVKKTIISFMMIVVPLLFIAAIIESYITPLVANYFV